MVTLDGKYYGQETPRLQIRSLLGAIRGSVSNITDDIVNPRRAADQINRYLNAIEHINKNCPNLEKWPESAIPTPEGPPSGYIP